MARREVCIACGNTGDFPHRVKVGSAELVLCGRCFSEAQDFLALSETDPPVIAVAKLLALRNPRKRPRAVERMRAAGVEVPWKGNEGQVEFFHALVRKRRKEVEAEARRRKAEAGALNHKYAWLEEIEEFLEKEVENRGMEWEIDDWGADGQKPVCGQSRDLSLGEDLPRGHAGRA
ncbi:hypothetical protein [Ammonifex thiophilus]|uniref:Uncharacterized protein n=1 Tax=Ammonifex thiophilus TaxID=444093 RepID=A0A3D8P3P1_9THEO|nr:hypothetical protein [Ammonifex thiophilus]RDV81835.1 hypothetical protein DXX99_08650 [Ammonifex thiophilus]